MHQTELPLNKRRPGRPAQDKERVTVTLDRKNVEKAKRVASNFSGLLDRLLADWLGKAA